MQSRLNPIYAFHHSLYNKTVKDIGKIEKVTSY